MDGATSNSTSGTSVTSNATSATLLNNRIGRRENLATSANTTTAPNTPTTVNKTVVPSASGGKSVNPNSATDTLRITTLTTTAATMASGPTYNNFPKETRSPPTPFIDVASTLSLLCPPDKTGTLGYSVYIHINIDNSIRQQ